MAVRVDQRELWVFIQADQDGIGDVSYGLIAEARKLLSERAGAGSVTAVVKDDALPDPVFEGLGPYGADRVLRFPEGPESACRTEYDALALSCLASERQPSLILLAQDEETLDVAARLAAHLEAPFISRAVDLAWSGERSARAVRPISNGYLFEEREFSLDPTAVVSFLPHLLTGSEPEERALAEVFHVQIPDLTAELTLRVVEEVAADPAKLAVDEAEIVVSGGRGVGRDEGFDRVHELARLIGGSVGGTRPVVDMQVLPFERQIGQTGKTVSPRLLFAWGISGANEYTAGMEGSQRVVAVNTDPRARIFRFCDLAVLADAREVLPLLIERIKALKEDER